MDVNLNEYQILTLRANYIKSQMLYGGAECGIKAQEVFALQEFQMKLVMLERSFYGIEEKYFDEDDEG